MHWALVSHLSHLSPMPPSWGRSLYHRWRLGRREEILKKTRRTAFCLLFCSLFVLSVPGLWKTLLTAFSKDVVLWVLNTLLTICWFVCVCCSKICLWFWVRASLEKCQASLLDVSNPNAVCDGHGQFFSPCKMSTNSSRINSQQIKLWETYCWY